MMVKRDDDQDWLDALAGNPSPNADKSTIAKASALRNAIQRHNSQLLGDSYDVDSEFEKLKGRLVKEGLSNTSARSNSLTKRWAALIAAILSAFAFGAMMMRFAMIPAMEGTRSNGEMYSAPAGTHLQAVAVRVSSPSETMQAAIAEAGRNGMDFSVKAVDGGYDLAVYGLVPHSPSQEALKNSLGLNKAASGDVLLQIRKKD